MYTPSKYKKLFQALTLTALSSSLASQLIAVDGFTEPHIIVYGQVLALDSGNRHIIQDGTLEFSLVHKNDSSQRLELTTELSEIDNGTDYSYEVRIDQQYLPSIESQTEALAVSTISNDYYVESISLDGVEATYFDASQAAITTSFNDKAQQHRLDIVADFDDTDSDDDGIPDWWEELYGYNSLYAGDATLDDDDDTLTTLEEYQNGTAPDDDNTVPENRTSTIYVVPGSRSGVYINMIDINASESFYARLKTIPDGLTMYAQFSSSLIYEFTPGQTVVYLDEMKGGTYYMVADEDFEGGTATFQFSNTAITFSIEILPFTPDTLVSNPAEIWLNAADSSQLTLNGTLLEEWTDLAGDSANDAYQPISGNEPSYDTNDPYQVSFDGSAQYLFYNDADLDLTNYTLFMAVAPNALGDDDQTLFAHNDLQIQINGGDSDSYSDVLTAQENGRSLVGPAVSANNQLLFSYTSDSEDAYLSNLAQTLALVRSNSDTLSPVLPTIGARYDLIDPDVSRFFNGDLNEVIFFPEALNPKVKSWVDDYFLARWGSEDYTLWDFRFETAGVTITGSTYNAHIFAGGWGNDYFEGQSYDDLFRDGAGDDIMQGNNGADVFQFFEYSGTNTINDFDTDDSDVIDLSPIFAGKSGTPDDYITISYEVTHEAGQAPSVNTRLDLDFDGDGDLDQTILLANATYVQSDLKWLIGEGYIILGGPDYSNAITLSAASTFISELPNAYSITLTRSGNTESALEMTVNISGEATLNEDYYISGLSGSGSNRSLSFDRDETELTLSIIPIADTFDETESIRLAILPETWLDDADASALTLELLDAEWITIEAVNPYAERVVDAAGLVRVTRGGENMDSMTVDLVMTGTAENGIDYEFVQPNLYFAAGETVKDIELKPKSTGNIRGKSTVAQISVKPDTTQFNLLNPWTAAVTIVDQNTSSIHSFEDYIEEHQLNDDENDPNELPLFDNDNDTVSNMMEYALGTDPNDPDNFTELALQIHQINGVFEIWAITSPNAHDIQTNFEYTTNLNDYEDASDLFDLIIEPQQNDMQLRRYVSKFPTSDSDSRFFRISHSLLDLVQGTGDASFAVFDQSRTWEHDTKKSSFFASYDYGWVPLVEEGGLTTPDLENDNIAGFKTTFDGPFTLEFEWAVSSEEDYDYLILVIDEDPVDEISGEVDWTAYNHTEIEEGIHTIEFIYVKDEIISAGADKAYIRNLLIE